MALPQTNSPELLEDIISKFRPNNEFNKVVYGDALLTMSDTHGNYNILEEGLQRANESNMIVAYNGDAVNDYRLPLLLSEMGYKSQEEITNDYLKDNLSKQELEIFHGVQNVMKYGLENILEQVPKEHQEPLKTEFEKALNHYNSEFFQKRLQKLNEKFVEDKKDELIESNIAQRALYEVFMIEEAKSVANRLNKYSDVTVLFNHGNHDNAFFAHMVKQYLVNPDQIVDMNHQKGYIILEDKEGVQTTLAGVSNTVHFMPYLSTTFAPEEISMLYHHMLAETKDSYAEGELSQDIVKGKHYNDHEYKRIKEGNEKRDLDILFSHGQVGNAVFRDDIKALPQPYLASAAKLSLEAKLRVEGHIHHPYFNIEKGIIRPSGGTGSIIKKDKDGKFDIEEIIFGSEYLGENQPIEYNTDYLKQKTLQVIAEYRRRNPELKRLEAA